MYIPVNVKQKVVEGSTTYNFSGLADGVTDSDLLPHLLRSASDLEDLEEVVKARYTSGEGQSATTIEKNITPDEGKSYALAKYLLNNGCYVLLQIVATDSDAEWSKRFDKLKDKGLYDPKFLTLGEFAAEPTFQTIGAMVGCAERRGDCIALVDHKQDLSDVGSASDSYSAKVHQWILQSAVKSSYAAFFSPWCSNSIYSVKETPSGGTSSVTTFPMLPPSFSFLIAYANSVKTNPAWLAAAGAFRGAVPGLVKVDVKYGEQDIDNIQCREVTYSGGKESFGEQDNVGIAGNPICNIDPFGVIIWGNRTALQNGGALKATSFLNIRVLACDVKKTMWKAARRYTFEQNTLRLWLNFCSQIRPLLDQAKTGEGISSYKFVQEETTAKARLKARIIIVPIEAVEDFELSFVLEDSIETEESAG